MIYIKTFEGYNGGGFLSKFKSALDDIVVLLRGDLKSLEIEELKHIIRKYESVCKKNNIESVDQLITKTVSGIESSDGDFSEVLQESSLFKKAKILFGSLGFLSGLSFIISNLDDYYRSETLVKIHDISQSIFGKWAPIFGVALILIGTIMAVSAILEDYEVK